MSSGRSDDERSAAYVHYVRQRKYVNALAVKDLIEACVPDARNARIQDGGEEDGFGHMVLFENDRKHVNLDFLRPHFLPPEAKA